MNTSSPRNQRRASGRARQRGATAVFVAFALPMLTAVIALVIDIGQLYYAQRDLEKLATLAALDASRAQSGCFIGGDGTPGSLNAAVASVNSTLVANNVVAGDGITPTVRFGRYDATITPGRRVFAVLTESDPAVDSVQVTLTRPQPAPLVPFIFSSGGGGALGNLTASASAQHAPVASFMIGTTTVSLNQVSPLNGLLTGLLGSSVNLNLIGYQGLANANVTLVGLQTALGIANPGDLLSTELPLGTLINAIATAAGNAGQTAVAATLDTLAALADPSRTTTLGEALGIEDGVENLVGALPLNTLQLLQSLAFSAANGLYPIELNLGANVLNLVSLRTFLQVGQLAQPSLAFDGTGAGRPGSSGGLARTSAKTQQVTLRLRFVVNNVPGLSALAQVKLGLDLGVSGATSNLRSILCPSALSIPVRTQPVVELGTVVRPVTLSVGSFSNTNPSNPVTSGSLLNVAFGLLSIKLNNSIDASVAGTGTETDPVKTLFTGPFPSDPVVVGTVVSLSDTVNGLSASLRGNLDICITPLLCLPAGSLASAVLGILGPVTQVLDLVVQPLLQVLGVQLGAATITVLNVGYGNGSNGVPIADGYSVPSLFTTQIPPATPPATR